MKQSTMIASLTIAGTLLAAGVSWSSLDLPRPALTTDLQPIIDDIQALDQFGRDTRILVLQNDWWRLQTKIEDIQDKLGEAPRNPHLREMARRLKRDQAEVQRQIDTLENGKH